MDERGGRTRRFALLNKGKAALFLIPKMCDNQAILYLRSNFSLPFKLKFELQSIRTIPFPTPPQGTDYA